MGDEGYIKEGYKENNSVSKPTVTELVNNKIERDLNTIAELMCIHDTHIAFVTVPGKVVINKVFKFEDVTYDPEDKGLMIRIKEV